MPTKLNLKIQGATDAADRELLAGNLKAQDGIKSFKLFSFKGYVVITMDIDTHKISQQEIFDIIKLGGDFKIEEQSETADTVSAAPDGSLTKAAFVLGLLAGLAVVFLAGIIILGYILFKSNSA